MTKTIVQMIFEQHATDSLRKTLAEVERAAAGKLHNESLSDYITRLASLRYDAERTNRELDAYREENQRHYAISAENGRVDEEPVEDYMVRVWHSLGVAQRFAEEMKTKLQAEEGRYSKLLSETTGKLLASSVRIDSLEKKLDDVRRCARKHGWNEPYGMTDDASLCDFLKTALDVSQLGIAALRAQVDDLKAGEAESKAAAEEYGVLPDETHAQFIKRVLGDLAIAKEEARRERERANHINAEAEENMKKRWSCADKLGRKDYEPLSNFMERQASEIAGLKKRIDDVFADKTQNEVTKYLYDCADKLGRGTTETIADFMKRQDAAIDRQTNHISEAAKSLDLARQSLHDKGHALLRMSAWHEENLQKIRELEEDSKRKDQTVVRLQKVLTAIHGAAKAGGLKQGEKIGAFIERLNAEMYKLRCDAASESMKMGNTNKQLQRSYDESRLWSAEELKTARAESLRARTELSEISKIVNPEGENGPVIDFVQAMTNRLTTSHRLHSGAVQERNNAQEEVRKLSDELSALRGRATLTCEELSAAQIRVSQLSSDIEAIIKTATACGLACKESVSAFIERLLRNNAELRKARDGYQPLELELRKVQTLMVRLEGNTARAGRADGEDLVDFIWRQHYEKGLAREQSAKEVARLSELVAGLQVELDEAKSKYGGIMAQLGNETPMQLIERMQRLSQEQRASTIPQDERAALVGEIADLRKRLETRTAEHAKLDYYVNCLRICASHHGLRKGEELKSFINNKCNELAEAMKTVESQSAAIAEAQQATEKHSEVVQAAAKLRDWASTIRHKVLVPMVHTKAMTEYDNIMKELDSKAGTDGC